MTKWINPAYRSVFNRTAVGTHRPGTAVTELDADHLIPTTAPDALAAAVRDFLTAL
ncbi:hypothetical protein LN042_06425 [Kitasatospora sp. RB6PN24]|uniref:hypothetical protein n=1 Tax=Kitasatospora humi TaxID=2893891 RepID=UPI001E39F4F6|nr:hypothetical protein [Kitasatospora humi]MCC9306745.1 hypothetical protein [Kitasatospora humi]